MATSEMESRKNAGPFMPKWFKVRSSNKALSGKQFSPDITPALNKYDDTLKDYDAILRKRDELSKIISDLLEDNTEAVHQIQDETTEVADLTKKSMASMKKDAEQLRKCANGKKMEAKEVLAALSDVTTKAKGFIDERDSKWVDITAIAQANLKRFEKARDDFKSKSDSLDDEEKKLAATAQKYQSDVTRTLNQYSVIAREIDHEEIIKSLQSLTKEFQK
jgi:hypothetical protein